MSYIGAHGCSCYHKINKLINNTPRKRAKHIGITFEMATSY